MASGLWEIAFPPFCAACGKVLPAEGIFCEACQPTLTAVPAPCCARCSEPGAHPSGVCERCARRPPPFARAWAPFMHEGAIARAIHLFKYEDRPELAVQLAALLQVHARAFLEATPGALCAIPLHAKRYRERRYDQAQLVAAELARLTGRPLLTGALERVRATRRQVELHEQDRELNVAGAFAGRAPAKGQRVILVDDVLTTGATARAAANALRAAGAVEVAVLTLARAHNP